VEHESEPPAPGTLQFHALARREGDRSPHELRRDRQLAPAAVHQGREPEGQVAPKGGLTPRELEVLRLVSDGTTDKEIAARLNISQRTVKNHLHNILAKLQLQNRVQAAAYAFREGLVPKGP